MAQHFFSTEERTFLVKEVLKADSMFTERVKEKFAEKFPASKMPDRKTVYSLSNKFDDTVVFVNKVSFVYLVSFFSYILAFLRLIISIM
jgi:hypothetical protein